MNKDAEDRFSRIDARLSAVSSKISFLRRSYEQAEDLEERIAKRIENSVSDIRYVVYLTLVLVAVLVSLLAGVLLKTVFG
ncbi:MAG: hypothetical protein ACE5DI_04695 [Candidatus Micrarchaeia archaeon]